ncbi:MAG TPA: hypothetical protein VK178_14585 [Opitutaceae bacterium]|nr:hypothetical protein [Opitutaceae bacterium]
MYRTIAVLLVSVATVAAETNESPIGLLSRVPEPPRIICDDYSDAEKVFHDDLVKVTREIQREANARNREQKAHAKEREAEIREQMMKQAGLTQEQIDKIKASGKQGREARAKTKREIAQQVLQQQADLTIDEAKALKVPTKRPNKERGEADITDPKTKAWVAQQMAVARANAEARTPEEQAAEEQKRKRLADAQKIAQDQKVLLAATFAGREVVLDKIHALEAEADEFRRTSIEPLLDQLERIGNPHLDADRAEFERAQEAAEHGEVLLNPSPRSESSESSGSSGSSSSSTSSGSVGSGGSDDDGKAKLMELKRKEIADAFGQYCGHFSNRYCDLLREYLVWARSAQPQLERYEEMENERMKLIADAPDLTLIARPGGLGMEEAKACVNLMASAFRYTKEYRDWKRATTPAEPDGETP